MADRVRRIVVLGGASPLGGAVVELLRSSSGVAHVRGLETRPQRDLPEDAEIDVVPLVPDPRPFAEYLEKECIDTVIQCDLVADRSGRARGVQEAEVIATMCLGAAISHEGSKVRSWVVASSSAVYPIGSHTGLLQTERQELPHEGETLAASILEAEDYARDVAHRLPHVNVAILRLQQLVGQGVRGPLASLLARDPIPSPVGFDPVIQLLHLDDAASALAFAAQVELAGIYNVASAGVIHWHDALRATGRSRFPVLPASAALLEPLLERIGIPFVPAELLDLLRFGHAIDTQKIERAGWRSQNDQVECLSRLRGD